MPDPLAALIRDVPDYPKPGIVFKDLTPLLEDAAGLREAVDRIAAGHEVGSVDKVVGIEARGFVLAAAVAYVLNAGLVLVRKPGKLPREVHERSYDLEYGSNTLAVHQAAPVVPGRGGGLHQQRGRQDNQREQRARKAGGEGHGQTKHPTCPAHATQPAAGRCPEKRRDRRSGLRACQP